MSKKGKVGLSAYICGPKATIAFCFLGLLGFGYVFFTRPSLGELFISEGRIIEQKVLEETLDIRKATDSKKRKLENVAAREIVAASSQENDGSPFDLNRGGIIDYFTTVIANIKSTISKCTYMVINMAAIKTKISGEVEKVKSFAAEQRIERSKKNNPAPSPKKIDKSLTGDLEVSEDIPKKSKSVVREQRVEMFEKNNVAPLPNKIGKVPTGDLEVSEAIPQEPTAFQQTKKKTGDSNSFEGRTSDQVAKESSRQTARKPEKEVEPSSHEQEKATTNSVSSIATWPKANEMENSSGQPSEKVPASRAMLQKREKKLKLRFNHVERVPFIARATQKKKKLEKDEVIAQPGEKRSLGARAAEHSLEKVQNTKEIFVEVSDSHEAIIDGKTGEQPASIVDSSVSGRISRKTEQAGKTPRPALVAHGIASNVNEQESSPEERDTTARLALEHTGGARDAEKRATSLVMADADRVPSPKKKSAVARIAVGRSDRESASVSRLHTTSTNEEQVERQLPSVVKPIRKASSAVPAVKGSNTKEKPITLINEQVGSIDARAAAVAKETIPKPKDKEVETVASKETEVKLEEKGDFISVTNDSIVKREGNEIKFSVEADAKPGDKKDVSSKQGNSKPDDEVAKRKKETVSSQQGSSISAVAKPKATLPKRTKEAVVVPQASSTIAVAKVVSSYQTEATSGQAKAKKNIQPDSIPSVAEAKLVQDNASKEIRQDSVRGVVKPIVTNANTERKSVVQLKKVITTAAAREPIAVANLVSADPAEATLNQAKTKKRNIGPESIPAIVKMKSGQESAKVIDGGKESSERLVRRRLRKRMAVFDKLKHMSQSLRETITTRAGGGVAANAGAARDEYHNKYNLVHVVHTDFLQYQRELEHLREARFLLFNAFTLPSMRQQQNQDFLWMIWVDPKIQDEVAGRLLEYLDGMPNVVVLRYFRDKKQDFRDLNGIGNDNDLQEAFLAGSVKLFMEYYEASQSRLLLETRLDADDALHRDFTESIQRDAFGTIGKSDVDDDFRIFCAEHHVEWRYYKPSDERNEQGHLVHYHNPSFCINSGLTIAYQTEVKSRHLQTLEQCNMNTWFQACVLSGYTGAETDIIPGTGSIRHKCVARARILIDEKQEQKHLSPSSYRQVVLMARAPTSAGMKRVVGTEQTYKETYESMASQEEAWHIMEHDFGVQKAKIMQVRRLMEGDIRSILREALEGQCMPGHSCSAVTKRKLLNLLDKVKDEDMSRALRRRYT